MAANKLSNSKRSSFLPKKADGTILGGPGRPKGVPNKITSQAKENIAAVFDGLGGVDRMLEWAETHLNEFYINVYPKLIPLQVQGHINAEVKDGDGRLLASAMVDALCRIQAARASGESGVGVIIDNEPARDAEPRLVLSSKTGTKAA